VARVAVYTWNFHPWLAEEALTTGVSGYLSKSLTARRLLAALTAIHAGQKVIAPGRGGTEPVRERWPGHELGLSAREAEVLSLITAGLTNQEIAERTFLSVNSIKSHVRRCYQKIGVDTRPKAVLWGLNHGLHPEQVIASHTPRVAVAPRRGQRPALGKSRPRTAYPPSGEPADLS